MSFPPQNQPPQDPYGQPQQNPYGQPPQNPYGQPPQNPYGQPQQNPYGQGLPPQPPYGQPYGQQPPRRSGCKIAAIVGVVLLLACGIGGFFLFRLGLGEVREVTATIDGFMQAGENDDPSAALGFFVSNATDEDELAGMFNQREYFDGYKEVKISGFNANADGSGTRATVNGSVVYDDGHSSNMDATLVRVEGGKWLIQRIDLN